MPIASTMNQCVRNTSCTPASRSARLASGGPGTTLSASGRGSDGAPVPVRICRRADYAFTAGERSAEQDGRAEVLRNARSGRGGIAEPSDDPRRGRRGRHGARNGRCREVDVQVTALRGADTDRDGQRQVRTGGSAPINHPRGIGSQGATRSIQHLDRSMAVAAETQRQPGREAGRHDAEAQYKPEKQPDREAHAGGTMRAHVEPCKPPRPLGAGGSGSGRQRRCRARGAGRRDAPRKAVAAAARADLGKHPGHRVGGRAAGCEQPTADLIGPQLGVVTSGASEQRSRRGRQVTAVEEMPELMRERSRQLVVVEEIDQRSRHTDTPVRPGPGADCLSRQHSPVDTGVGK